MRPAVYLYCDMKWNCSWVCSSDSRVDIINILNKMILSISILNSINIFVTLWWNSNEKQIDGKIYSHFIDAVVGPVKLPVMPQPVITQAAGLFSHLLPGSGRHTAPVWGLNATQFPSVPLSLSRAMSYSQPWLWYFLWMTMCSGDKVRSKSSCSSVW